MDSGKAQRARTRVPAACGRLTLCQGLQEFPRSCQEFFIWGTLPALPLKPSATFKCFAGERKQVVGGLMSPDWVTPWCAQPGASSLPLGFLVTIWDLVGIKMGCSAGGTIQ